MADEAGVDKLYYKHNSPSIVNKILKEKYPGVKALSRQNVHRIVKKFELHGTVNDRRKAASGRPRSARSDERTVIGETLTKSVRMLDNETIISAIKSTIHKILRYDLKIAL